MGSHKHRRYPGPTNLFLLCGWVDIKCPMSELAMLLSNPTPVSLETLASANEAQDCSMQPVFINKTTF